MANIEVVTSFNKRLYDLSSKIMLDSYEKHVGDDISIHVYFEGDNPPVDNHNKVTWERYKDMKSIMSFHKMADTRQNGLIQKQTNGRYANGNMFRFDAKRFSWKGFALADHALTVSYTHLTLPTICSV